MPTSADSIRGRVGLAAEVGEGLLVHAVDEKPAKVSGATPVDPEWARRAGREAVVPLRFVVTAAGGRTDPD